MVDAFSRDGQHYLRVDYVQVERSRNGRRIKITNENDKLRTFLVPSGARLDEVTFSDLVEASDEERPEP